LSHSLTRDKSHSLAPDKSHSLVYASTTLSFTCRYLVLPFEMFSFGHVWSLRCLVFEMFLPYPGGVQAIYRMMLRRHYHKQVAHITHAATVVGHILVSVGHLKVSLSLVSLLSLSCPSLVPLLSLSCPSLVYAGQGKVSRPRAPPSLSSCPALFNVSGEASKDGALWHSLSVSIRLYLSTSQAYHMSICREHVT